MKLTDCVADDGGQRGGGKLAGSSERIPVIELEYDAFDEGVF